MSFLDRVRRLRQAFTSGLTAANLIDRICESHADLPVYHPNPRLPYVGLEGETISPRQLRGFLNRMGHVLRQAGMQRFDRVAIYKTNEPDYVFMSLAIIRAGGISVPINGGMGMEDLRRYLEHTGARILITDARHFAKNIRDAQVLPNVQTWVFPEAPASFPAKHVDLRQALEQVPEELEPAILDEDSDVLIVHTSGTTGFPKGVITTSDAFVQGIRGHMTSPLPSRLRTVTATPFNHLVAHVSMTSGMFLKASIWPISHFEPREVLELMQRERIEFFAGFSDSYLRMYEEGLDPYDLSSVRFWLNAADSAHDIHIRAFVNKGVSLRLFGKPMMSSILFDGLGSSEVGSAALARAMHSKSPPALNRWLGKPRRFGPKVKIADEHGRALPTGEVGRLMVKGNTVFKGYWNAHDKLHGVMHNGWWWTGDVAYQDSRGNFYHLDRAVDVIHTSAGPVYSLLLEEIIISRPEVSEVAVIAVPKPGEGMVAVALMYPTPGQTLDPEALLAWVNERSRQPRGLERIVVVEPDEIPRGLTGKVLKRVLRERYANFFQAQSAAA